MNIKRFILAGKSIFTLYSTKVDKRYTYKIRRDRKNEERYFVEVMFGPDNIKDYRFLGWFYDNNMILKSSIKCCVNESDLRFRMLRQFLDMVYYDTELPETCEFYPSGRCGRCGRLLTTPESIERGIGPECWKYVEVA